MPRRVVIFDLDGTLIDSMGPAEDLFCAMLRDEHAIAEAVSRPAFQRLMGKGPKAQFTALFRELNAGDEALVEDITRRYWQTVEQDVPALFPEALEVLEALHAEGYSLAVSSGGIPTSVQRKTRVTGIDSLFRVVLGSKEGPLGPAKGAGHFGVIASTMGLSAAELRAASVFVGDGVYDMQVALDAGIPGIGRLTGDNGDALSAAGAAALIADLRQLRGVLDWL